MELRKNMGIWVKGDSELNTSAHRHGTHGLFTPWRCRVSLASLEIHSELG